MSHLVVDQRSKTSSRLDDGWGGGGKGRLRGG